MSGQWLGVVLRRAAHVQAPRKAFSPSLGWVVIRDLFPCGPHPVSVCSEQSWQGGLPVPGYPRL